MLCLLLQTAYLAPCAHDRSIKLLLSLNHVQEQSHLLGGGGGVVGGCINRKSVSGVSAVFIITCISLSLIILQKLSR